MHALTHAHTHPFNGNISRTTRVSRYQKGKTNLDFTEARDSEWHQLGRMQVCISLPTDNHASTPPLSFLQAGCPSCRPTNSFKALKALLSIKCFTMSGTAHTHTHTHIRWNSHLCGRHCWSQKEYQWETLSAICVWWLPCQSHSWLTTLDVDGLLSCNRPPIWIWLQDHQATVFVDHPCWLLAGCSSGGGAAAILAHTPLQAGTQLKSSLRPGIGQLRPGNEISRKLTSLEKSLRKKYLGTIVQSRKKWTCIINLARRRVRCECWIYSFYCLQSHNLITGKLLSLKTVHILFHSKP